MIISKVNPLYETVCYQIGGTIFEIETSCGSSGLLYSKMTRFIKLETVKILGDKESQVRYNNDSTLFAGLSLQKERTANTYPDNITALHARLSQEDALVSGNSSIASQKRTLFQYAADNNFSANLFPPRRRFRRNRDRQGWGEMIRLAEDGKAKTVIGKDISRMSGIL